MHIQPPTKIEVQGRRIKRKKRTGGGGSGFCSLASPQPLLHFSGILTRTRLIVNSGEEEEINAPFYALYTNSSIRKFYSRNVVFFPDKPYSLAARKGAAKGFGSSFGPIDTRKFRARFSAVAGLIYDLVRFLS